MRLAFAVPVLALSVLPEGGGPKAALPDRPPCMVAQEWVQKHPHVIPATISGFALFPKYYKRAAYNDMSVDERVALWREHLAIYSGPASNLTAVQKQFIASISKVLPEIFSRANTKASLDAFGATAVRSLGKRTAVVVFGNLGLIDPTLITISALNQDPVPASVVGMALGIARGDKKSSIYRFASVDNPEELAAQLSYVNSNLDGIKAYPSAMNVCSCHTGGFVDFCNDITGPPSQCYQTNACEPTQSFGCGWLWLQQCDGLCS